MPDALTTITNLINSPPGVVVAGAALAGIVWKFFERVEAVLTENTKLEIAVWLLGVKLGRAVESWPQTFARVFDQVFGEKHLSWKCFWRSCLASYAIVVLFALNFVRQFGHVRIAGMDSINVVVVVTLCFTLFCNVIPDYISLLETRLVLRLMKRSTLVGVYPAFLMLDLIVTVGLASGATLVGGYVLLHLPPLDAFHYLPTTLRLTSLMSTSVIF
jgi:hypothetical protein